MMMGLYCDGLINTKETSLYKMHSAYIPDNDYFSKCTFPIEWIEIFERDEYKSKSDESDIYRPIC